MEFRRRPAIESEAKQQQLIVRHNLLTELARHYEKDSTEFIVLPPNLVDSALIREVVAQLRNEGSVEEKVRGTIRLTARGHNAFCAAGLHACWL